MIISKYLDRELGMDKEQREENLDFILYVLNRLKDKKGTSERLLNKIDTSIELVQNLKRLNK